MRNKAFKLKVTVQGSTKDRKMPDNKLKTLLQRDSILVVPAAFDMVSAKIIEKGGFEAVYLSGFGHSAPNSH